MRVPIMLIPLKKSEGLLRSFRGFGALFSRAFPSLKYDLREAGIELGPAEFVTASLLSSLIYGILFFAIAFAVLSARSFEEPIRFSLAIGLGFFFFFLIIHLYYPRILAHKLAASVDKDLIFALKDMLMQVNAGVSLFDAMTNISRSNYGQVSTEFAIAVREINSGEAEDVALEKLALRTESEHMKRAVWQLITAIRSGAALSETLRGLTTMLMNYKYRAIKNYSSELNFFILIYMLFAAVAPTIGTTLLVLLSAFGGIEVTPFIFMTLIFSSFMFQVIMVGLINSRRPEVHV